MIRSVAVVMRGTVLAQVLGLLILPVLTRHFTPVAFGHFQVFQSFVGLTLVAATLRYEIAILRAETPKELGALLILCATINLTVGVLLLFGGLLYEHATGTDVERAFGFPLGWVFLAFLFGGSAQYLGYFLVREEMFSKSANSKIVQGVINGGTALTLALTSPSTNGIIKADICGRVAAVVAMIAFGQKQLRARVERPSFATIVAMMQKYREYPLIALPGGLVNMASATLTPIMIYRTFDAATSGQFGLLERSASLPVALLGTSISQVYMAQLASDLRTHNEGALPRFKRLIAILAAVSVPPAMLVALLAPWLFATVFGPGWEQASQFAQLMMPTYALAVLAGAVNMTLIVAGWQRTQFGWEIARLAAMSALWVGGPRLGWNVRTMVAAHSAILGGFAILLILLSGLAVGATSRQPRGAAEDDGKEAAR